MEAKSSRIPVLHTVKLASQIQFRSIPCVKQGILMLWILVDLWNRNDREVLAMYSQTHNSSYCWQKSCLGWAITAQLLFAFCKMLRFPQLLLGQAPENLFTACPKPNFCVRSGPVNSWRLKTVGAFRSWFSLLRLSIFICFVVRFYYRNCVFLQLQFGGYVKWVPKVWYRWRHVRLLQGLATWIS